MNSITACGKCGGQVNDQMRFCSGCGTKLSSRRPGYLKYSLGVAVALFGVAYGLQMIGRDGRAAPAAHPSGATSGAKGAAKSEVAQSSPSAESPELVTMRKAVEAAPEDLQKLKAFAGMLGDLLRQNPGASSDLVFEAIDVYGKILQREPNDPTALVMMADVSFDQKAFTKALDFYERYLAIDSKDLGARARYASTLTFLGRYDDSISELGKVLESDPNNFPAMAYLAITYAQKGETSKAKAVGADALNLAPSDDARARFASFVSSLGDADKDVAQVKPRDSQVEPRESQVEQKGETGINGFIQSIKANPVAGVKFKSYEYAPNGTITLKFADFPMAQMPPFAKEKFFTGLKQALIKNGLRDVKEIAFIDAATGEVMDRVGVGGE